ncbi:SlyX family protein [Neptuniibacter sp. CAU 1671]|uniref:SlyX family protein n=1 Tax=Neptuniibacter sp. CAU 1671 TaxID=3032593 RepID=UPI0023DB3DCF|nr:SlyX family protein [Neptuniibacter sp. CAU 1671]MDF2182230.1 SlyX family protein [Neptuniibacter sp. CAU 1671]
MNTEDRVTELETRVAFQEDTLDKLNQVVSQQELDIERLTRMLKLMHQQLQSLSQNGISSADDSTPPPHY